MGGSGAQAAEATWQFDASGRTREAVVAAHRTLVQDGEMSAWSAASWLVYVHPELEGRSPLDWDAQGNEPARLASVAARDAARAAQ